MSAQGEQKALNLFTVLIFINVAIFIAIHTRFRGELRATFVFISEV